ncbi:hypothetical protein [Vibrio sp. F74]|uniref:hypothetical protein n=1 Tax=Vibrio sp. F74 TaxID=700020 RepID=UPI0035F5B07C
MKSIYLDWNVFQDLFQTRRGQEFNSAIQSVKRKYKTPFSCAHMRDLSRCRSEEYVNKDLAETQRVSDGYCVGLSQNNEDVLIERVPIKQVFDAVKEDSTIAGQSVASFLLFDEYEVAVDELSPDNIVVPYLDKNGRKMSPKLLMDFVEALRVDILNDHRIQKKFRASLKEVMALGNPAFAAIENMPLYKYWLSTKEEITENFESIVNSFLSITGKSTDTIPFGEKITTSYNILVFFPAYWETIDRRNNTNNVTTDAEHVLLASSSRYFVCGDEKMVEKASIVYTTFGIKTKVMTPDMFMRTVKVE